MGRLQAMVRTANELLLAGVPEGTSDKVVHRLGKIDTEHGKDSLKASAQLGIPYAALLYERFLGRPFAGHRDSVSELVGDALESAIERQLHPLGREQPQDEAGGEGSRLRAVAGLHHPVLDKPTGHH